MSFAVAGHGFRAAAARLLQRSTSPVTGVAGLIIARPSIVASKTTRPPRKRKPSLAEVQIALGVADDPFTSPDGGPSSSSSSSSPLTKLLMTESPAERKLREAAEWMVDRTEAKAQSGQQVLLLLCLNIFPVWLLLLLVASGVVQLPFDLPLWNDLIS